MCLRLTPLIYITQKPNIPKPLSSVSECNENDVDLGAEIESVMHSGSVLINLLHNFLISLGV